MMGHRWFLDYFNLEHDTYRDRLSKDPMNFAIDYRNIDNNGFSYHLLLVVL